MPANKTYTYARYPPTIPPIIQHIDTEEDLKQAVLDNPETIFDDTVDSNGGWYMKNMEGKILAIVSDQMCADLDARRDKAEAWVKENERREAAGEPPLEPVCWRREDK
ncbi:hypothetical protein BBP40_008279 [Aspergillus hancockii]|nr:hypothetical protein BBP40_008279 [Aspergillus hancockii]